MLYLFELFESSYPRSWQYKDAVRSFVIKYPHLNLKYNENNEDDSFQVKNG
jgi:hypothetical protein